MTIVGIANTFFLPLISNRTIERLADASYGMFFRHTVRFPVAPQVQRAATTVMPGDALVLCITMVSLPARTADYAGFERLLLVYAKRKFRR